MLRARLSGALLVSALVLAGATAPSALADEGVFGTAATHAKEDAVTHTASQEKALTSRTKAVTAQDVTAAAAAVAGGPQDVGSWGPVTPWPVVGVHVALLPNGKVVAYDSIGDAATETYPNQTFSRATVWDPGSGGQTAVNVDTGFNIFCSGLAHLMDGRLFLAGGNKDQQLNGIIQTHTFDGATNTWSRGPDMAAGRWYPSVTPQPNGEMLITSGYVDVPEVRKTDGTLRRLSTASLTLPLYPWMDVAPDGRTFLSGPEPGLRSLDTTGTGTWQSQGQRDMINRDYGSHAIYDIGKTLVTGGGPSTKDARVIDVNGATPNVTATSPMAFGRRQHNLTVLADGSVLATGGNSSGAGLVDLNNGVYAAERWNPSTGTWATLAPQQVTRQYHSTALLLPDGRVLSSGGGICGECDRVGYLAKNAEVFSPPYLYAADGTPATRPKIDDAPATASHGAQFQVATGDAAAIRKVALVRLGAVTHSNDMEQRYVPLAFTAGTAGLTVTGPKNANVAPPGYYMLFVIDAAGVPSVAKMVRVVLDGVVDPPPPPPAATDKALNQPATASSVEAAGLEAAKANDGNAATRWSSTWTDGQWWRVDLGSARNVDSVELNWEDAYAKSYKVQTSLDGTSFTDAATETITAAGVHKTSFTARSARYVRILGVTRATQYGMSFYDAKVFGPDDGTTVPPPPPPPTTAPDKALDQPATASSVQAAGMEAAKANDGNPTTRWSSTWTDGQWWRVDLGSARNVDTVELTWEDAYAKSYKVQTSLDGTTFSDAATVDITAPGLKRTTFTARSARYVRVLGVTRATQYGMSFYDARVFGPDDGVVTPPPPPPPPPPPTDTDKALNKTATASSTQAAGLEPRKANDGDSTTRWSSTATDGQWWRVDLGTSRNVDAVELNWEAAYAKTYKVQTSSNGTKFTDAATVTITAGGVQRTSFTARSARYVRILCVTRGTTQYGISFWDAKVFGPADL